MLVLWNSTACRLRRQLDGSFQLQRACPPAGWIKQTTPTHTQVGLRRPGPVVAGPASDRLGGLARACPSARPSSLSGDSVPPLPSRFLPHSRRAVASACLLACTRRSLAAARPSRRDRPGAACPQGTGRTAAGGTTPVAVPAYHGSGDGIPSVSGPVPLSDLRRRRPGPCAVPVCVAAACRLARPVACHLGRRHTICDQQVTPKWG